jgi:outer membrane biosynthesis protein TonB
MRKTVLFSAAVAAVFIASVFVGVAAAMTGAPVLYDARSPQPVATGSGDVDVDAGEAQGEDQQVPADGADTDDAPLPSPTTPTTPRPSPAPSPSPVPSPSTPPVADPIPTPEEQQAWLGFQQLVRECMVAAGQEYREWEWWSTEPRDPTSTAPAMPDGLTEEGEAAWRLALEGDGGENDGCLGEAVRADQANPVVPPAAPPAPESPSPSPEATRPEAVTPGA